jgi:putative transposase
MYRYRKLTKAQQQAIVAERRAHGFPLHKPPHLKLGDGWYFVTAATYEHRKVFQASSELTSLTQDLLTGTRNQGILVAAWVVMPNHYHVLLKVDVLRKVGTLVGRIHGKSSRFANLRDGQIGRQVWYKYSDRKIRSERHWYTCIHYIIANPVKHGFAKSIEQWPWSCYHELLHNHGLGWLEDLRREYPLLEFGSGWDEYLES